MISLKIDVDTHDGMRDGVPRLLDCLRRHQVHATFFLAFGPDRSGLAAVKALRSPRFLRKMLTTGAPSLYGWRTMLSGTLLPPRPVAAAFPDLVRRIEAEGHETAVHAWDHRDWQDNLSTFSDSRICKHLDRACAAFRAATGHDPSGIGAPAWMTTERSLMLQEAYPFRYASDLRGGPPCRLVVRGHTLRIAQFPGTGRCLEELLATGVRERGAIIAALLADLRSCPYAQRVLTLHAEVEGGPFMDVLEAVLPAIADLGSVVRMDEAARRLVDLPLRAPQWIQIPGRSIPVSSSRELAVAI